VSGDAGSYSISYRAFGITRMHQTNRGNPHHCSVGITTQPALVRVYAGLKGFHRLLGTGSHVGCIVATNLIIPLNQRLGRALHRNCSFGRDNRRQSHGLLGVVGDLAG